MKDFPKTEILKKIEWLQDVFVIRREELSFEVDESIKEAFLEVIAEFEELLNRSCDGCIHKNSEGVMEYSCFECSRYYADKFEKKDKQ